MITCTWWLLFICCICRHSMFGLMWYYFVLLDNKLGAIHSGNYRPRQSSRRDCGHGNPFGRLWSHGQSSFIQWARWACIVYVLLCVVFWGNSLSFGLYFIDCNGFKYIRWSGQGKGMIVRILLLIYVLRVFWYSDSMDLIWKQWFISGGFVEMFYIKMKIFIMVCGMWQSCCENKYQKLGLFESHVIGKDVYVIGAD